MSRPRMIVISLTLAAGCGGKATPPADSTAIARRVADSVLAAHTQGASALLDTARQTMAQILKRPETAKFDSLVVTQPAMKDGAWPEPAVCGRIGGKPGVSGSARMTPFIYLNRLTVFVLDQTNAEAFGQKRAEYCDGAGVKVLRQ